MNVRIDNLKQDKPWAVLGWTRKQWKKSKMWKRAGVSEHKMTQLILALDYKTVQCLKENAQAEALIDNMFGNDD